MKKYNIVLAEPQATKFKLWLKGYNISYESSSYGDGIYFNIMATEKQARDINRAIERLYRMESI